MTQKTTITVTRKPIEWTEDTINAFTELFIVLRRIRTRLINDGIDFEAEKKRLNIVTIYDLIERGEIDIKLIS